MAANFISFPPGAISCSGARLAILQDCEGFVALDKPPNIDVTKIMQAIQPARQQISALGVSCPKAVYPMDEEISGVFLIAKTKTDIEVLRNLYGSQLCEFTFDFIAFASQIAKVADLCCDLPVARHFSENKMVVSHKTGKKSLTSFRFVRSYGPYEHWTARCTFFRQHQVRIHASECGIKIIGENIYSDKIRLNHARKFAKPVDFDSHWTTDYMPLHLSICEIKSLNCRVEAPLPKKFNALINLIKR